MLEMGSGSALRDLGGGREEKIEEDLGSGSEENTEEGFAGPLNLEETSFESSSCCCCCC